jgi:acyl-CoA synthetase (AMP-forming)/AMP-acid ligase II
MAYDPTRLRAYLEHDFTYDAGFRRNVRRYSHHLAVIEPDTGRELTYTELDAEVERAASALVERGVGRGERVVYQLFNCLEFAVLYLATQRLGAVGVPINFRLSPGETAHILAESSPRVFVHDATLGAEGRRAIELSGLEPDVLVVDGAGGSFADALAAASTPVPPLPDDYSTYEETTRLYTSGTTGLPKGVSLPSIVEIMSAHDVGMHFPLSPYDRTLNMTPWFHRGGLYSGGPNPVFYLGGGVVPLRAFDPAKVLDWVGRYGLTFLIGAPTTLEMLADEQERSPRDLSTLRGIVTMGAPLDRAAALRYQELLTPRIFNGYGTTEGFWNTFLRPEDLPEHAGSAGRACTDDDVAVVRAYPERKAEPDDEVARDGAEIGEVIMRSPKSGFAYVGGGDLDAEKFHRGWLYTGDLGTWDADGFVTILGRKDDMLISGGENVYPVQVEETLQRHPAVRDAVVVGVPDERWGQRVVAYVIPAEGATVTAADLDAHCVADDSLASFKRPRGYRFVDAVPMTATGKKMHFKLAEKAAADAEAGLFEVPSTGQQS